MKNGADGFDDVVLGLEPGHVQRRLRRRRARSGGSARRPSSCACRAARPGPCARPAARSASSGSWRKRGLVLQAPQQAVQQAEARRRRGAAATVSHSSTKAARARAAAVLRRLRRGARTVEQARSRPRRQIKTGTARRRRRTCQAHALGCDAAASERARVAAKARPVGRPGERDGTLAALQAAGVGRPALAPA